MCAIININQPFIYVKSNKSGENRGEKWEKKEALKSPIVISKKCPFTDEIVPFYLNSKKEERELNLVLNELRFEAKINYQNQFLMAA
jgi:hypothetical protein